MSLEATVVYLHLIDGIRQTEIPPAFTVRPAPNRSARGRDRDMLLLGIYFNGGTKPDLLDMAAKVYFGSPGSVTSAARAAIQAVAARMAELNRRAPPEGAISGGMTCAVLRNNDLYVSQAGTGHVIVLHPNSLERFTSSSEPRAPFGSAALPEVQYFHTELNAGDVLLMTPSVPATWGANSLSVLVGIGVESALARLTRLSASEANAEALIARFATAEENAAARARPAVTASPPPTAAPTPAPVIEPPRQPVAEPAPPPKEFEPPVVAASEAEVEDDILNESESSSLAGIIARVRASSIMGEPPPGAPATAARPAQPDPSPPAAVQIGDHVYEFEEADNGADELEEFIESEPFEESNSLTDRMRAGLGAVRRGARRWLGALNLGKAEQRVKGGASNVGSLLSNVGGKALHLILPEGAIRPDAQLAIPNSVLVGIAVLFPIMVALVVGVVYVQRGRNQQFSEYLDAARLEAGLARTAPDTLTAVPHWKTAVNYLDQADAIYPNQPASAQLRAEAQQVIDSVEGIERKSFESIVPGGFGSTADLTEVVINETDVYALDSAHQTVYRATLNDTGRYSIDRSFQCGSGVVGQFVINRIVDIAWLTMPNIIGQPVLLALDDDGILLYCKPDGSPPEASQLIAPDLGWKAPKSMEIYTNRLYIFDPGANEIWQYDRTGGIFSDRPKNYFVGQTPDLSTAIGFSIAQGDVFILRADGRLIYCQRNAETLETACLDNALFTDTRPGYTSGERLTDVQTAAMLYYDPPPEPSLYLLDKSQNSIYQLSLKLVLQRQFRPVASPESSFAAVAVAPDKSLLVAAGNNIYRAQR